MLALQGRGSGGEKDEDDAFWDMLQLHEDLYASGSIESLRSLINNSTTKAIASAQGQKSSLSKPSEGHSDTSQSEQQQPATQGPAGDSTGSSIERNSLSVTSFDSFQRGWQEVDDQSALTSSDSRAAESPEEQGQSCAEADNPEDEAFVTLESQLRQSGTSKKVQTHSENLYGSMARSFTTGGPIRFRRPKPQPWPSPQHSLGELIHTENRKIKGKAWLAEGPALELFEAQIRPQIEKLLYNIEPPQCAPLFLSIYMMGKREASANPVIMICCCDRKARKDAEALIRESGILQQFPQIGLGNSASLLQTKSFVVPVTGRSPAIHMDHQSPTSFIIHGSGEPVIGRRLRFGRITDGQATVQFATGGPFIRIEKQIYQMTAVHIGQADTGIDFASQLDSDPDDCEYDGQSDTDDDDGQEETTVKGAFKETWHSPPEPSSKLFPVDIQRHGLFWENLSRWTPQDTSDVCGTLLSRSNIDYSLVKLHAEEASKASNYAIEKGGSYSVLQVTDIAASPEPGTPVVAVTSRGHFPGLILPGTPRVKMHGFHGFQGLHAARLSSSIKMGDSGSAVLDASTGCFYGHIILGSAPDTIAYIVSSVDTFTDIVAGFGKLPTLNVRPPIPTEQIPRVHQSQKRHTDPLTPAGSGRSSFSTSGF